MATVVGKTSEEVDRIVDALVSSVMLNPSGQLSITKGDGSVVNVGSVASDIVGATLESDGTLKLESRDGSVLTVGIVGTLDTRWPIGSIYFSVESANPSAKLGGGTWVQWGKGRMPIGVDPAQTEFDTVEETGGEKTHTLTTGELPSHDHGPGTLSTDNPGGHQHGINRRNASGTVGGAAMGAGTAASDMDSASAGGHTHDVTGGRTGAVGSGNAHQNMPPFITCYMWKRTA